MEQERRDSPPLWLQLPTSAAILRQRRRPPPISASLLIFITILFIFFLISNFVSNTSQVFRINLVKNGWDLLNVVLVVFAILCGLVGKLSDDQTSAVNSEVAILAGTVSNNIYDKETASFSIFDEFSASVRDAPASGSVCHRERRREVEDESDIKVIPVHTCLIRKRLSPPAVASKPKLRRRRSPKSVLQPEKELTGDGYVMRKSPPSTTIVRRPHNNNNRKKSGATNECGTAISWTNDTSMTTQVLPPVSPPHPSLPPPPPPPPPPSVFRNMFRKSNKPKRIHSEASTAPPPPPPLPPSKTATPPPPNSIFRFRNKHFKSSTSRPPQSIFSNILKSRIKSNRYDSSTATPPPATPPPPTSIFSSKFKLQLKSKLSRSSIDPPPPPPLPLPNSNVNNIFTATPPPPPPYPPPSIFNNLLKFGTKSKRFNSFSAPRPPQPESMHRPSSKPKTVKNESVDATGTQSSEIGVPSLSAIAEAVLEVSNLDLWSTVVGPEEVKEGNNQVGSVLCPSPDVNMKADKLIARLKNEWNLERMNSFKESPTSENIFIDEY